MKLFSIIVAIAQNHVIGNDLSLLWHIPEDFKHFKQITTGHTIIMGRKTFDSLPKGALPNRRNIVITRDIHFNAPNCIAVRSIEEAIKIADSDSENFIIGGAEIYKQFLPYCQKLYITEVHLPYIGNIFFEVINWNEFERTTTEMHHTSDKNKPSYSFSEYNSII